MAIIRDEASKCLSMVGGGCLRPRVDYSSCMPPKMLQNDHAPHVAPTKEVPRIPFRSGNVPTNVKAKPDTRSSPPD